MPGSGKRKRDGSTTRSKRTKYSRTKRGSMYSNAQTSLIGSRNGTIEKFAKNQTICVTRCRDVYTQVSTATDNLGSLYFTLSDLAGYSDMVTLFDEYQLYKVEVTFQPTITQSLSADRNPGALYTAVDYDDATAPGDATVLLQYGTCQISAPQERVTRCIYPRMAVAAYSGAFTSYANLKSQWIDIASSTVQHYGIKWCIKGSDYAYGYHVFARYHIKLRSTR